MSRGGPGLPRAGALGADGCGGLFTDSAGDGLEYTVDTVWGSITRLDVDPSGILRPRACFPDEPSRYEPGQACACSVCRDPRRIGDVAGAMPVAVLQQVEDKMVALFVPSKRPAWIHASPKCSRRFRPKSSTPPTVGTDRPWWEVRSPRVSRFRRVSCRVGAKHSEAARKSSASESSAGIGHSSKDSLLAKRCISAMRSASARRLVEPTRT